MQASLTASRSASPMRALRCPTGDSHDRAVADLISHAADAGDPCASKADEAALELLGDFFRDDDMVDQILIAAAIASRDIEARDMRAEVINRQLFHIGQMVVALTRNNAARLVDADAWQEVA